MALSMERQPNQNHLRHLVERSTYCRKRLQSAPQHAYPSLICPLQELLSCRLEGSEKGKLVFPTPLTVLIFLSDHISCLYEWSFLSIMHLHFVTGLFSENHPETEHLFSRLNETFFLLLIILLSKLQLGREQWKPEFQGQEEGCQVTVGNLGREPISYQLRGTLFIF